MSTPQSVPPSSSNGSHAHQPEPPRRAFDPNQPSLNRPRLRPVRGFPVQAQTPDGKAVQLLGLVDAKQVSDKMVAFPPAVQMVLPLMDGSRSLEQIVAQVGRGLELKVLQDIVMQLDDAALLFSPAFDTLMEQVRRDFDSSENLPPASSAAFAEALVAQELGQDASPEQKNAAIAGKIREIFDQWMSKSLEKVDRPSFDTLPKAIVAPHLDYGRGWMNYANVYGRLRVCDRPARVVVLGTNHFGFGTGVVGCNKGFVTPLGTCKADHQLIARIQGILGDKLFEHRTDHEREHSIELQVPWIQHVFGTDEHGEFVPIFGALVHDPTVKNGASYDGNGVDLETFVKALKESLAGLPGRTLIISSADLSHVGPAFGDKKPLAGDQDQEVVNFRNSVMQHDLAMLKLVTENKPSELTASMAWQQNPTRWCSTGNLVATLMLSQSDSIELLNYAGAMDQQGTTLVTSAAMVMR